MTEQHLLAHDGGANGVTAPIEASVIIPTYNRVAPLQTCLEALCRQTQNPDDFEVVVVVDGSTDGTVEMLERLTTPFSLKIIYQSNSGQPSALNRGAEAASGRILIFTDDDIRVAPQFVAEHTRLHRRQANALGVGQMILTLPPNADWFTRFFAQDWNSHYRRLNQEDGQPGWQDCFGGNMSVARSMYLQVGGNDVSLTRDYDVELAYRLERAGCRSVYLPEALAYIDEQKGFRELTKNIENSGYHAVELTKRYPETLPSLIGFFTDYRLSYVLLWRLLLHLRISPYFLERIGRLVPRHGSLQEWYRFLERYCYWRGVRRASPNRQFWRNLTYGTPILMYHAFGAGDERASRYVIPIHRFKRQLAWLKRFGYKALSLDDYLQYRREFRLAPARSVVITIDDGYKDNRTLAYPVLREYGFPATVFLVTGQLGGNYYSEVESELNSRAMMSWADILEMAQGGITFGAHTRRHPDLRLLTLEQAREEIAGSKRDLELRLDSSVRTFSYPFGNYNEEIRALAAEVGFQGSCSIDTGLNTPNTPLHDLRRVEIYGTDNMLDFACAVRFGERSETLKEFFVAWLAGLTANVRWKAAEGSFRKHMSQEKPENAS